MTAAAGHSPTSSICHSPSRSRGRAGLGVRRLGILTSVAVMGVWLSAGLGMGRAAAAPLQASATGSGVVLNVSASPSSTVSLQVYAMVDVNGGNNPTGQLTFDLFGPNDPTCSSAPVFVSTVPVGGTAVDSGFYTTTMAGTYQWEVSYGGDANNAPTPATACSAPSSAVQVGQYNTNLQVTGEPSSNGTMRASASLNGYNPTGTVTFYLTPPGNTFCSSAPVFTTTVPVNGSGNYLSAPYVYPVGGSYKWQASYSGDANNMVDGSTACLGDNNTVTMPAPPTTGLLYPQNGLSGADPTVPVTWQPVQGAQAYFLTIGTIQDGWDLVWSGDLPATQTSYAVPGLPAGTLSAVLYTEVANAWTAQVISFTAAANQAALTSPTSFATGVNPNGTFTWSSVNGVAGVQGYALWISTTYGGANLLGTSMLPASQTSYTPPALPAGKTLYVILFTERNGVFVDQDITISTGAVGKGNHMVSAAKGTVPATPPGVPSQPAP